MTGFGGVVRLVVMTHPTHCPCPDCRPHAARKSRKHQRDERKDIAARRAARKPTEPLAPAARTCSCEPNMHLCWFFADGTH